MEFNNWLNQTKIDEPELEAFITKLEPFFTDSGFKGDVFERKVTLGLKQIETEVEQALKPDLNAED